MAAGLWFFNDRDLDTDFGLAVTDFSGFPGILAGASRDVPLLTGPEMQGAIIDPRLIRRKSNTATVKGVITAASVSLALAALDALRGLVNSGGEIAVRSVYAPDRQCFAVCTDCQGDTFEGEAVTGHVMVSLSFVVKDGVAVRLQPDGIALTTTRTACPIGTAESKPMIVVHGGGASLTNPVVTLRNAAGDIVQSQSFTVVLGSTAALLIDCARILISKVTAGVVTDGISYWSAGDFLLLRPSDGWAELGAYPSVELSASAGTPVGLITYTRAYA